MQINREPSIHLRLNELLKEVKVHCVSLEQYNDIKHSIIKLQKHTNLNNRNIKISNDKILKEVKKITTSNVSDTELFNNILHLIRKSRYKNNRVQKIDKKSNQFSIIKKATELAIEFCEQNKLTHKEGFKIYINKVMDLNNGKKFWLNNLVTKFENVVDSYDIEKQLENSEDSALAEEIREVFEMKFESITGLRWEASENIYHKIHYIDAAKLCIEFGISSKIIVDSLFSFISESQGTQFPSPGMLASEKARFRLTKYMYKNNIKAKKLIQKKTDWNKIFVKDEE